MCIRDSSWAGSLAFQPDWATLSAEQIDAAGVTVMDSIGGEAFTAFFVAVYVVGAFGSGMTGQVSVCLLYTSTAHRRYHRRDPRSPARPHRATR